MTIMGHKSRARTDEAARKARSLRAVVAGASGILVVVLMAACDGDSSPSASAPAACGPAGPVDANSVTDGGPYSQCPDGWICGHPAPGYLFKCCQTSPAFCNR